MMEAVTSPLGHRKERKMGVDRSPAIHRDCLGAGALLGCCFWEEFWSPQTAKQSVLSALPAKRCKLEAVNTPLGHIKERKVGATRPPAMHRDCLEADEALFGC